METLDYGQIASRRARMSIGYLPQEGLALTGRTVLKVPDGLRRAKNMARRLSGLRATGRTGPSPVLE